MATLIRTLVIDHNRLFREGLKLMLRDSDFSIVREEKSLIELLKHEISDDGVQLIIVDGGVGATEELDALRRVRALLPQVRMVVLSDVLLPPLLHIVLSDGIDGVLLKDMSSEALIQSLALVMIGEKVFPTQLALMLVSGDLPVHPPLPGPVAHGLSPRDAEILRYLITGFPNKMIARRMDVSEATVKVYLKSLLRKIQVKNRTQAAIWAFNNGYAETKKPADLDGVKSPQRQVEVMF
jgi:two-component system nitrate/nitrite response regulator NarL